MGAVYGWGYEGSTVADLVEFCQRIRADIVVDVRMNAISRKKGFSKSALSQELKSEGIEYVHLRALGNPKDNRAGFGAPGTPAAAMAQSRFQEEVLQSREGGDQLRYATELAERRTIVLFCFEQAPECCHRRLVMEAIRDAASTTSTR